MKEHFLDRLYGEFQTYSASLLICMDAGISGRHHGIDVAVNFHGIMGEKAERMPGCGMGISLKDEELLPELYNSCLRKTDSISMEMAAYVEGEAADIIKKISGNRREE